MARKTGRKNSWAFLLADGGTKENTPKPKPKIKRKRRKRRRSASEISQEFEATEENLRYFRKRAREAERRGNEDASVYYQIMADSIDRRMRGIDDKAEARKRRLEKRRASYKRRQKEKKARPNKAWASAKLAIMDMQQSREPEKT